MKNGNHILVVLLGLLVSSCSNDEDLIQQDIIDCINHYRAESYLVAATSCEKAANSGVVQAQWLVGDIYYYDRSNQGTTKEEGFNWYLKAAENGLPDAQTFVGESYMYAEAVNQDFDKAYHWLTKAAAYRDPHAEFAIGMLFYNGDGRPKDISSALSWFEKSALQGHSMGINNLAWIYATSPHQVFRNEEKALFWAQKLDITTPDKAMFLDTQAAAYALAEQYEKAISLQNQAIAMLPEEIEEKQLLEYQKHLEAYQKQLPWREDE